MIRLFDIVFSFIGLLILLPFFIFFSLFIAIGSGFPVFFTQERIGLLGKPFYLIKFRTMREGSNESGLLTVGDRDSRITKVGYYLRKYKMDELPQLFNVLKGDMSFVGPRPEVSKYVELYNEEQRHVLDVRPGITDIASITYLDESEVLSRSEDPERAYVEKIMPHKIQLNLQYLEKRSLLTDIGVILRTLRGILR